MEGVIFFKCFNWRSKSLECYFDIKQWEIYLCSIRYYWKNRFKIRNSLKDASLLTWGRSDNVRLKYGSCYYNYNRFVESLYGNHWYILGLNDCQNFARRVVNELTDKWLEFFLLRMDLNTVKI